MSVPEVVAHVLLTDGATETKTRPPGTARGVSRFVPRTLAPDCFRSFAPQHQAYPSTVSAHVCALPEAIVVNFALVDSFVGVVRTLVLPSPSCPLSFRPSTMRCRRLRVRTRICRLPTFSRTSAPMTLPGESTHRCGSL